MKLAVARVLYPTLISPPFIEMASNSKTEPLAQKPFSYRKFKNGKISISYENKEITILRKKSAEKFSHAIEDATEMEAQMIMAKVTGNFKHGNERDASQKEKSKNS